jgi:hypothetical protein
MSEDNVAAAVPRFTRHGKINRPLRSDMTPASEPEQVGLDLDSAVAAITWIAAFLGTFDKTYGRLGAVIGFS